MKSYRAEITGVTPLLVHRFQESNELVKNTRRVHIDTKKTPRELATAAANIAPDGSYFVSGMAFSRLIREVGGGHKQKGSRKSMKFVIPAALMILDETVTILNLDKTPAKTFEVDSRPVVIPATKGRIMRHRPRFEQWAMKFSLRINDLMIDESTIHQFLVEGGQGLGIGDFRPEKGGPFGTFNVTSWQEMK